MKQLYSLSAKLLAIFLAALVLFSMLSVGVSAVGNVSAESLISTYTADFEDNYYQNLKSDTCNAGEIIEENGSKALDFTVNSSNENYRFEIYNSKNGDLTLNDGKVYAVTVNYKVVRVGGEDESAATFINLVRYTGKGDQLVKVNVFPNAVYYSGNTTEWVTSTIVFKAGVASSPEYNRLAINVVSSSCPTVESNVEDNTTSIIFDNITVTECTENTKALEFNSNGGSYCDIVLAQAGQEITLPTPTRDLYKFAGWFKDPELTSEFKGSTMPNSLTTKLYAKWEVAEDSVVVTFVSNCGQSVPVAVGRAGDPLTLPTLERSNFNFGGWFDSELAQRFNQKTFPAENVTVYAKWETIVQYVNFENPEVYDKPNNGSFTKRCIIGSDKYKTDNSVASGENALHYSFQRGFDLSGSAGKGTPAGVMLKDEYGQYIRPTAGKTYVVSFKYKIVEYISSRGVITLIASASNGPWTDRLQFKEATLQYGAEDVGKGWRSHTFTVKWDELVSGSNYLNFAISGEAQVLVDDIYIYEYDEKAVTQRDKVMLCFDTAGAEPIDTVYADRDTDFTLPQLEREGYRFLGWTYDAEGTEAIDTETIKLDKNYQKVYAEWYKIPPVVEEPEPEVEVNTEPEKTSALGGILLYIIIGIAAVVVIAGAVVVVIIVKRKKK